MPDATITERLHIAPLQLSDAADLTQALTDPDVYQHIVGPFPTSEEDLREQFARIIAGPPPHFKDERWLNFTVRLRSKGQAIGRLESALIGERAEIAYLFDPSFQGHGYATEASRWLLHRLSQEPQVRSAWATVHPNNARSIRLLERLGFTLYTGELPFLASYDDGDAVFMRPVVDPSSGAPVPER